MLDLRDFTHQLSERQANDISKIITDIRTFYANDVVGRILQADPHTKITATDNYRDVAGAIPIPATFSLEIGRLTSSRDNTASVRPIGLPVLEYLEGRRDEEQSAEDYVFPGWEDDTPFGSFPRQWTKILAKTELAGITPHVLRHSFASIGNDLGFTEATIAALVGHSRGTVTSRYIHTVDTALIMAADSIAGYIQGLLDGVAFTHTAYALDRDSRKSALAHFLGKPTHGGRSAERSAA
jgi:site-specific recombinase XerD